MWAFIIAMGLTLSKLTVDQEHVYVISSFDQVDYFSTFSRTGEFVWETPFSTQIQSWKLEENQLYILSQTRYQSRSRPACYLSCLNPENGEVIWEKGIFAPPDSLGIVKE